MRIKLLLLIGGISCCIFAAVEFRLWSQGTSQPETITLADLGSSDSLSNIHFEITDFTVNDDYIVEQDEKSDKVRKGWFLLEIPANDPLDPLKSNPTERPVIAQISGDEDHMGEVLRSNQLRGVITSIGSGLDKDVKQKLAASLQKGSLDDAIKFEVDRSFPSLIWVIPLFLGGIFLILAFLYLTFIRQSA
ncbi:hypothetical protein DTL42_12300 [Bremerella cremea]|uniref:Uncharacterized protein n=1 Tax=Bremerella cremea TaxID=1031537 RepID=A0A368KT69_9BACT|nr:hypothetical protein [Bremerella cremea]RCS49310.1 hypothetical protein DTL42_12300 [Bremerella cremea]